jgi:membrane protease subunit HflK
MPWSNDGKNGGSWKPDNPGPWGAPPQPHPPNFEDWLRRAQARLRSWLPGGGLGGRALAALGLLGVLLWSLSGFYTVGPNEVGLNMIFGRYTGKTTSGLNYNLPYPIGAVEKLAVTDRNTINIGFVSRQDDRTGEVTTFDLPEESLMLTGDQNIADVKFVVIWQIDPSRPEDYAFNVADPDDTVKAVAESAMREVIGHSLIQNILTAERKVIEPEVQDAMQKILDHYKAGVLILQVQLQSVDPPPEVIAAFRDVTAAQQDRDRIRNEADAYANRVVPVARGQAAAIRQQAEGYRLQTIDEATGQASRFAQIEVEYKNAPALTRERIYLETMEKILAGSNKVIVDSAQGPGVLPYLPLPQLTPNTSAEGSSK